MANDVIDRSHAAIVGSPDQITSDWLSAVLSRRALTVDAVTAIGTGQMSQSYRVTFTDNQAENGSVVVKLASHDPSSFQAGFGLGAYSREIAFYADLGRRLGDAVPKAHFAEYDVETGQFTLVLEDIASAIQGDQIAGATHAQAQLAMRALARIHAPVLGDIAVGVSEYMNLPNPFNQTLLESVLPGFIERYGAHFTGEHIDIFRRFVAVADAWAADRRPPLGLVHGDFRLDNQLFTADKCTVVDWQTVAWGPAMTDAAYFLGTGLSPDDRRRYEKGLVRTYHDELVTLGVQNFSWQSCWEEYRRQTFYGLVIGIAAAMLVEQTDRGDAMFIAAIQRNVQQILDLDAMSLLPRSGAKPAPLQPNSEDEATHTPGSEPTWNESWYFDAVSDDATLAVYTRIGRVPNQDHCVYTAAIVGRGFSPLLITNYAAPLTAIDDVTQAISVDGLSVHHHLEEPLRRFRVTLDACAQQHRDDAAPLRNETGVHVPVAFDLTWHTDGVPFAWRQSTRYEIPCRVTGTVRIGDQKFSFAGPGQRDHSWGSRDWWANDWMWNAFHLSDGTRTHTVTIPELPGIGFGYIQRGGVVTEIETATTTQTVAENGLINTARVVIGEGDLDITVEPIAWGALRLEAPDGRVTHFPRAAASIRTADGRRGIGWIEWNRNRR
jgi:hypothetical protein